MSLQSGHREVHIYEAQSAIRNPLRVLQSILKDLYETRQLAITLAVRDLKAQYRQSLLGFVWMALPPLIMAVGMTVLRQNKIVSLHGPENVPYLAYVFISVTLWGVFMEAVNGPIKALSVSRGILTRVNFPRETVVMSEIIKQGVDITIRLGIIVLILLFYRIAPTPWLLLFPFALVNLVLMGTMFGVFLAPLGLLYKDVTSALPLIGYGWMFLTPVVMSLKDLAPGGLYATAVKLNPVTPFLMVSRELLIGMPLTDLKMYAVWSVITVFGLLIGLICFRVSMPMVIERWSS